MHEAFGVLHGMLWGQGHTCAGRAGLTPSGLPAEVHGRLALWHTGLPCQAARKEENIGTQSYGIWGLNSPLSPSSPSVLWHPQPTAQEVLESQPAF